MPGLATEPVHTHEYFWTLDIPDHVERMRQKFMGTKGKSRDIEIRWKGKTNEAYFKVNKSDLEKYGWDLLETTLVPGLGIPRFAHSPPVVEHTMCRNKEYVSRVILKE